MQIGDHSRRRWLSTGCDLVLSSDVPPDPNAMESVVYSTHRSPLWSGNRSLKRKVLPRRDRREPIQFTWPAIDNLCMRIFGLRPVSSEKPQGIVGCEYDVGSCKFIAERS